MEKLSVLPIARYCFQFQVTQPIVLPDYAGSALRGVFGRALRKICCMTKQPECKSCPLYRTCPYTNIFETPAPENHQLQHFSQVPNGYIIEPPEWGVKEYQTGEILQFHLVLVGKLISQLPLITFAFKRALEYDLAGGKANLTNLYLSPINQPVQSILENDRIIDHQDYVCLPKQFSSQMELDFQTPLRLQENGKPLRANQITLERFLISLAKRISLLMEFHAVPIALDFPTLIAQIPQIKSSHQLHWQDWTRYSSRQKQKMTLGGLMGKWQLENVSSEWAKLLYIGQWLHNGKNTTFGLGHYYITNL
ncbi:CRISPR system precrRNA processing endoribonuclease RAMP protein Cas6 [Gallibacterium melopsittaci]|uniref:CRISPR system precrRNA processing endoribonuclease RAMP protein Cas6 n=1 Tax=Gallibacterium melopsittaci TaxID=516063 RepID=A0ABV6HV71_9PAST